MSTCFIYRLLVQYIQRLATGCSSWGSNPQGGEALCAVQTGPEVHPVSCTTSTDSYQGVKRMLLPAVMPVLILLKYRCLLKHVAEGKTEGRIEVTERRERISKQLLDDMKEMRG